MTTPERHAGGSTLGRDFLAMEGLGKRGDVEFVSKFDQLALAAGR
jgi:hypothetical protein